MNWNDWYKAVAHMDRVELVEAFESEAKLRSRVQSQLVKSEDESLKLEAKLKRAISSRQIYVVGASIREIDYAARRMGLKPNKFIYVNTSASDDVQLRGLTLNPEDVRLVRGWTHGKYARQVRDSLAMCLMKDKNQVGIDALAYAPHPHDETI